MGCHHKAKHCIAKTENCASLNIHEHTWRGRAFADLTLEIPRMDCGAKKTFAQQQGMFGIDKNFKGFNMATPCSDA